MSIYENAAEKAKNSGSMIAFFIPFNEAEKIQELFSHISGDQVLPRDAHITLGLVHNHKGNEDKIRKILGAIAPKLSPFGLSIDEFGFFPPNKHNDNKFVLYAKPEARELNSIHDLVLPIFKKNGIEIDNGSFAFSPHMTIKYCHAEPDLSNVGIHDEVKINHISFAIGDEHHHFKMGE